MSEFFGETHRAFQDQHDTRRLADRLESLARATFDDNDRGFIDSSTFIFLSTDDERGRPTVSYKGGPPGFIRVTGSNELVFPVYDGNGMFLSLGNIASTAQVGLLFISFEAPRRLRIQGEARVMANDGPHRTPGAIHLVHIAATQIFVNCGRYIHKLAQQRLSPHVPDESGRQPFPAWKRLDFIADTLSDQDQNRVKARGGPIPLTEYPGEDSPDKNDS
jgi:predicted pyridoxine 5'-phosphate oxidase superfamily flavin-nucleotide-binding protein